MLKRIIIEHYRSCLKTAIDFHPELSVIIGPNSSGKTNILQAIMLLNKITQPDEYTSDAPESATRFTQIEAKFREGNNSANLNATIMAFTDDSNNDVLVHAQQKWNLKNIRGERATTHLPIFRYMLPDKTWRIPNRPFLLRSYKQQTSLYYGKKKFQSWVPYTLEKILRFCAGMRYYGASQFTNPGACPVSFEIEKEGKSSRPLRLKGHARILYDLYNIYTAQKGLSHARYSQFLDVIGSKGLGLVDKIFFKEIKTSSTEYSVSVGGRIERRRAEKVLVVPQFKCGKNILSPNQLSEGTFKTIALLFYIITEESTALLIEEPEVCVHLGLLFSILQLIKEYSTNKQMIVSTHSDYVLDQVKPENVFVVSATPREGTIVRPIRKTMSDKEYRALRFYLKHEGNLGEYCRDGGM